MYYLRKLASRGVLQSIWRSSQAGRCVCVVENDFDDGAFRVDESIADVALTRII